MDTNSGLTLVESRISMTIVGSALAATRMAHNLGTTIAALCLLGCAPAELKSGGLEPTPGVDIYPGDNIQQHVNAEPPGTRFNIKAGVHHGQSVVPKDNDSFIGEAGAILTGDDTTQYAFMWADRRFPRNVTIRGLVIEHYNPPPYLGAILGGWNQPGMSTTGWVIESCEIRYNSTGGVRIGNQLRLSHSHIHHNGLEGVSGEGDDVLIEGNEIAYNNYENKFDPGFEAGGTKFVETNRLIVRGNFVHHNTGPGLWTDIDNRNTLYENNRIEDNTQGGIVHEISYSAIIRGNVIRRNGSTSTWVNQAGILIVNSPDVEIYNNIVAENTNAITAAQQNRGDGPYGPHIIFNVYVHNNDVAPGNGYVGLVQDVGDTTIYTLATMRFANNTYRLLPLTTPFRWKDRLAVASEWRGFGHDVTGVFEN